jgi:hypothetical protein
MGSAALQTGWGYSALAVRLGRNRLRASRGIGRRSGSIFPQVVLDSVSMSDDNVYDFGSIAIRGLSGIGRPKPGSLSQLT